MWTLGELCLASYQVHVHANESKEHSEQEVLSTQSVPGQHVTLHRVGISKREWLGLSVQ